MASPIGAQFGPNYQLSWLSENREFGPTLGELGPNPLEFRAHPRYSLSQRPKTGDDRSIPISAKLAPLLAGQPRCGQWVFTAPPSPAYPRGDHQLSERRLLEYLKKVLEPLGLPGHVHTFRHTFISLALCAGVPEAVVRSWVGHVDPQVIRLYTHVHDETSLAAMERLEQARQTSSRPEGKE